jgi:hypothetical protein
MDRQYHPYQPRNPFQGSRETSPNPSMTDLSQLRPSPLRNNVALRKDQRSGSRTGATDGDKNKPFHLRNPFSSSADTSPTGSIADLELEHLSQGNGQPHGPSARAQSSLRSSNAGYNISNMNQDRDAISLQDEGAGSVSGYARRHKHEFKSYLLTGT